MAFIHHQSSESVDSGLDLWTIPTTQTSIESGMYIEYFPLASLSPSSNIEFFINQKGSGDYLDLSNTYLYVRAKIQQSDGTPLPQDAPVGPVNNWLHSLFSQCDVSLNNTLVSPSENTYAYKAYLEDLLSYDRGAKKSQMTANMYYRDSSGHFEEVKGDIKNSGMIVRRSLTSKSQEVSMMGKLHVDIMNMSRYLLNGVDVKIRLVKSKDSFSLMANCPEGICYTSVLTHVSLFVRKCKLNPAVMLAHNAALTKAPAKYPYKRVSLKTVAIPMGSLSVTEDNLFMSQLPNRVIIGLIDSDAFNGNLNKNPFNFKHHSLSYISLFVDGQQIPSTPLTPDFKNNIYVRSFYRLFSELGMASKDEGNYIEMRDFPYGYALYAFDLTPSILDGDQCELVRSGNLRLELKFAEALPHPVHTILFGEKDAIFEITHSREVVTDFSG